MSGAFASNIGPFQILIGVGGGGDHCFNSGRNSFVLVDEFNNFRIQSIHEVLNFGCFLGNPRPRYQLSILSNIIIHQTVLYQGFELSSGCHFIRDWSKRHKESSFEGIPGQKSGSNSCVLIESLVSPCCSSSTVHKGHHECYLLLIGIIDHCVHLEVEFARF